MSATVNIRTDTPERMNSIASVTILAYMASTDTRRTAMDIDSIRASIHPGPVQ